MSPARSSVKACSVRAARADFRPLGAPAPQQPVLGDHRELQLRRDEALAQGARRRTRGRPRRAAASPSRNDRAQAGEVVGRPLGLAAARPRDDGRVTAPDELLELGLGLRDRARGGVGGLGAECVRLVLRGRRQRHGDAALERLCDGLGGQVEMVRVVANAGSW